MLRARSTRDDWRERGRCEDAAAICKGASAVNAICNTGVECQVRRIPLAALTIDPTVQQRVVGTSEDVVADYADAMRDGVEFPNIDVFSTEDGSFISRTVFTACGHTYQRIPTRKKSNAGFAPAIVTMRFCSRRRERRTAAQPVG